MASSSGVFADVSIDDLPFLFDRAVQLLTDGGRSACEQPSKQHRDAEACLCLLLLNDIVRRFPDSRALRNRLLNCSASDSLARAVVNIAVNNSSSLQSIASSCAQPSVVLPSLVGVEWRISAVVASRAMPRWQLQRPDITLTLTLASGPGVDDSDEVGDRNTPDQRVLLSISSHDLIQLTSQLTVALSEFDQLKIGYRRIP